DRDRLLARRLGPTIELGAQRTQVADGPHRLDPVLGDHRYPGRSIAAILELAEAVEQQIVDRSPPDVTDDPAHRSDDTSGPLGGRGGLTELALDERDQASADV